MTPAELDKLLALPITPVGWQRRRKYDCPSDPPGMIHQWKQCSKHEATDHFDKVPGFEYRPIYGPDAMTALAEARAEVERLRAACFDTVGSWLSAALDDPEVCDEMKADIEAWFAELQKDTPE